MNIVIIADVGREQHTGDEAMFEVALDELAARGADSFTVIAPAPVAGIRHHNLRVITPIGFSGQPGSAYDDEREKRLELVMADATDDADIAQVSQAVRIADAVVIAGGGNLSASWPHHLYERVALLELAARHEVPSIVCGQTIGPVLTSRQSTRLGHALGHARFVGARDLPSLTLLSNIGAGENAALQVDDAIALSGGPLDQSLPSNYVALCAHQYAADPTSVARDVAALVTDLHRSSALPVVIFPNTDTDHQLANEAATVVADNTIVSVASLTTATATADGIRRSSALVSLRYHPMVFALAAGVPCMAVTSDQYTGIKLEGALQHAGLEGWQVPTDALRTPITAELFDELWARRTEIQKHLLAITPAWFESHRRRWDAIWSAITDDTADVAKVIRSATTDVGGAVPHPNSPAARCSAWVAAKGRERLELADRRFDTAEESAFSLRRTLEAREVEIEGWRTLAADLERRLQSFEPPQRRPTE